VFRYERYKKTRFWAVYEGETLICLTVYLKGALTLIERITGVRPDPPLRKQRAPLPPIYRPKQEPLFINDSK
jgi:hypothetical protein